MKKLSYLTAVTLFSSLTACGEAEKANRHLESLERQAERMANSMEALQKLGVDTMQIFNNGFKPKAPAQTDDIEDILGMDNPDAKKSDDSNKKSEPVVKKEESK